jgi:hypothetical protein
VLTNGPRGPGGEGIGEEVRDAVTRKATALVGEAERRRGEGEAEEAGVTGVLGSRGSGSSSRAAPASRRAVLLRAHSFSSSSSPLLLLLWLAGVWAGDRISRGGYGWESSGGCGSGLL